MKVAEGGFGLNGCVLSVTNIKGRLAVCSTEPRSYAAEIPRSWTGAASQHDPVDVSGGKGTG